MRAHWHGHLWSASQAVIPVREHEDGISFLVKLHPRAKKNGVTGEIGDALKLALTAPPIDGRANAACLGFFAKLLKVPHSSVTIASGERSRLKVVRVTGVTGEQFLQRISNA